MCCSDFTAKIYICNPTFTFLVNFCFVFVQFVFSFLFSSCFCLSFQLSLSQQISMYCSGFTAKFIYVCCLVKARGFHPGGIHSHFPSSHFVQFICAQCGGSGEVGAPGWLSNDCQATQTTGFPGPFRISANNLFLLSTPHHTV